MTASTQAAARTASAGILRRYYVAMAAPFVVDLVSLIAYVAINRAPESLASLVTLSAAFLLVGTDRKSTRLNSSHANISYAVFCLKKKKKKTIHNIFKSCLTDTEKKPHNYTS